VKDVNTTRLLRFLEKAAKNMGRNSRAWCCFHKTYGHDTEQCYTLARQIEDLIQRGLLQIVRTGMEEGKKEESEGMKEEKGERSDEGEEGHERPVMGDLNTITGGFSGGVVSNMDRRRYAQAVMHVAAEVASTPTVSFTKEDLEDVFPHDNDPIVISVVRKVDVFIAC